MVLTFLYAIVLLVVIRSAGPLPALWAGDWRSLSYRQTRSRAGPARGNAFCPTAMWLSHPRFTEATDPCAVDPQGAASGQDGPNSRSLRPPTTISIALAGTLPRLLRGAARARTFFAGGQRVRAASEIWAPRIAKRPRGLPDRRAAAAQAIDGLCDVAQAFDISPRSRREHADRARRPQPSPHHWSFCLPIACPARATRAVGDVLRSRWPTRWKRDLPAPPAVPACTPNRRCIVSCRASRPADRSTGSSTTHLPGFSTASRSATALSCASTAQRLDRGVGAGLRHPRARSSPRRPVDLELAGPGGPRTLRRTGLC